MKDHLKKAFSPVLNLFETDDSEYIYKSSYRSILIAVGALFLLLSLACLTTAFYTDQLGAWLPFIVFFCVGSVCEIVGFLGSDRAVAKIWGNR